MKSNKHFLRIWLYSFVSNFSLLYTPIIFLFFEAKGVNIAQIGILFGIGSLVTILTEVPIGVFSDNYSRKLSVLLGGISTIIGLVIYITGYGFFSMAIAMSMISLGIAFKSGATESILLTSIDNQDNFFQINNYARYIATALSATVIGLLYTIDSELPFLIAIACEAIILMLVLTVPNKRKNQSSSHNTSNGQTKITLNTVTQFMKVNLFICIVLFTSCFFIPQFIVFFPEYLNVQRIPIELFGVIYFVMNIIPLVGSVIYQKKLKTMDPEVLIIWSLLFFACGMLLMGIIKNVIIGLVIYGLLRVIIGWFWLIFSIYFNDLSNDHNKATILSIKGMIMNVAFILSDPLIGILIFQLDIFYSYLFTSIFIFIIVISLSVKLLHEKRRSKHNVYFER
ncbi:MFS transporter [Bacillus spongiae]|uniref:MFS transporter n=1 Tax=Bacillus spongiae TaxID=2683610 RepID=A0ABU8HHP1_9BACI